MKFALIALMAFAAQAVNVKYEESEGPTKVGLGEDDPLIMGRADDSTDPKVLDKWQKENPLEW